MNKITQTARYRQSLIHYAQKNGVTAAAIRYRTYRQYVYRWMKRYNGTLQSLEDRSHRPHSHPNQHRPEEIKLIGNMRRRNPNAGLVVFWVKLRQRGYTRSITGLYRFLRKSGQMAEKLPNPKYVPKETLIKSARADWRANQAPIEGEKCRNTLCISNFSQQKAAVDLPPSCA